MPGKKVTDFHLRSFKADRTRPASFERNRYGNVPSAPPARLPASGTLPRAGVAATNVLARFEQPGVPADASDQLPRHLLSAGPEQILGAEVMPAIGETRTAIYIGNPKVQFT